MPLYRPSELMHYLESLGVRPKKGMSQNFLIDGNILKKIVRLADVKDSDNVLEIGSGPGALTEILLGAAKNVVAIEKDAVFAEALAKQNHSNLTVYPEDVLAFPLDRLKPLAPLKLIANLPYALTTPILEKFVKERSLCSSLTVMVQEEVARRMTSPPGSKVFGSLSVFLQFFADVSYGFFVPRNCFYPVPDVDSAVVHLKLKAPPEVDEKAFFTIVRTAFQQRRKTIASSLKKLIPDIALVLEEAGISPKARPETLDLEEFLLIYRLAHEGGA